MLARSLFPIAFVALAALPLAGEAKLTGTVSEWYGGGPTTSPKKRALTSVTVVAGQGLNLETGSTGVDKIKGKVTAKTTTNDKGGYVLNLPSGKYTVVYWKAGYTPQVESNVDASEVRDVEISADKSGQGLHKELTLP